MNKAAVDMQFGPSQAFQATKQEDDGDLGRDKVQRTKLEGATCSIEGAACSGDRVVYCIEDLNYFEEEARCSGEGVGPMQLEEEQGFIEGGHIMSKMMEMRNCTYRGCNNQELKLTF